MLLCPISPHLAHPRSLHCGALSRAASSFCSQQQCHSINPLAGHTTVEERGCFLSNKSLLIILSCPAPCGSQGPKPPPSAWVACPARLALCMGFWNLCSGAHARWICISDFKSYVSEKKRPFAETKALSPPLLGGCKSSIFNKVIPDL